MIPVYLITGATDGIGRALAAALAATDARVIMHGQLDQPGLAPVLDGAAVDREIDKAFAFDLAFPVEFTDLHHDFFTPGVEAEFVFCAWIWTTSFGRSFRWRTVSFGNKVVDCCCLVAFFILSLFGGLPLRFK